MVCLNDERLFGLDEVGSLVLDRFEHPQEFEVVGVIVLFSQGKCSGVICDRVSFPRGDPLGPPVL